ncbi:hypothetical protein GCM10022226_37750 [Sphaerisporangium flaviroseum]|uniref:Histidine kinase/HSP90-like ATPase domain-containing protein n=1 Tax=Sphaerisporangium flaviroseum TaxID=509199 RepID=A0ABP7IA92_9ACTN
MTAASLLATIAGAVLVLRATGMEWALAQHVTQAVLHTLAGWALIRSRAGSRVGLILLVMGTAAAAEVLLWGYALSHWPGWTAANSVTNWVWVLFFVPFFTVLPALFPDGRPVTPRWWPVVWAGALATAVAALAAAHDGVFDGIGLFLVAVAVLSLASLVVRWARSGTTARQQIKFLLYAAGYVIVVELIIDLLPHHVRQGAILLIPVAPTVAIALAILKYRLYGIDLVIRRTFVYLAVTGLAFCGYLAVVALVGNALSRAVSPQVALLAAAATAALIESGRRLFQRRMSGVLYGYRDRPLDALAELRRQLGQAATVEEIARRTTPLVADALRSPGVTLVLLHNGVPEEISTFGKPGKEPQTVPLVAQGEQIGSLLIGPRAAREPYNDRDLMLIAELGHHAAGALAAARLSAELDQAREQTIRSAAEERKRLRQDLHDGLGPLLSGAGLGLDGIRRGLAPGSRTESELNVISDQVRMATREVRRIIEAMQPGRLADLGLVAAVQEHLERCAALPDGPRITNRVSQVDELPAAVAEAAYLVILEAITNVQRHAGAQRCEVTLCQTRDSLRVQIHDDGRGIGRGYVAGVGISSMRRRVTSIGGSFDIGPCDAGSHAIGSLDAGPFDKGSHDIGPCHEGSHDIASGRGTTVTAVFPLESP